MSQAGPSNLSQSTIVDLKAIAAEHVDRFAREGRKADKGHVRKEKVVKDPFQRPSPGLIKRLAAEARRDASRRDFGDTASSAEQSRIALEAKARKYEAMSRGDFSGMTEKELSEVVVDFDKKQAEGSSDSSFESDSEDDDNGDELDLVEYEDELGRTRRGTRKEAREAERARPKVMAPAPEVQPRTSFAEVQQSNVIYGEQNMFPVYEPDPEAIRQKYLEAEAAAQPHHYDATKEVRTRGAGQYQFALDEEKRAEQMESLKAQRQETERARDDLAKRSGQSAAQESRKRKLDERRALLEQKRIKAFGSKEALDKAREAKRESEVNRVLEDVYKQAQN